MVDVQDARPNAPEWSVSELSMALKRTVEDAFGHVRVRGEISGYRGPHSSGHAYFSLKDQGARLDAVVWKGVFSRLRVRPEEGLEVVAIGRLTTYPGKSGYQIVIEQLEFAGAGAIMAMLEERKRRLAAEGLFAAERKKPLPYLPQVIGVITSPTGAVIRDILHRLADRFPRRVLVWPVRVQGETSAEEVAQAIRGFNALPEGGLIPRPDVLVVARGGGSLEDLLGFSEEVVVRAAAESAIPLVSAVGHETDVTLIDFAADLRAPTPTAAAELVVPVRSDLIAQVEGLGARLAAAPVRLQERRRADLRALARLLPSPASLLEGPRQRLDVAADRLPRALAANAAAHRLRLQRAAGRLSLGTLHMRLARAEDRLVSLGARLGRGMETAVARRRERFSGLSGRLSLDTLRMRLARAEDDLAGLGARLGRGLETGVARRRERFSGLSGRLDGALRGQSQLLRQRRERVQGLGVRAGLAIGGLLRAERRRLSGLAQLLQALSYHGVLARGFALVRDEAGNAVRAAAGVAPGALLEIEFADGRLAARAEGGTAATAPAPRAAPGGRRGKKPPAAPTLFDP